MTKDRIEDIKENNGKKIVKEIIPYIVILIVVILIRTFLVTPVVVSGPSMKPTLEGGEVMILNKNGSIDRFDVIVAQIEKDGQIEDIIKRVIALPGETISCEDGIVYVNDKKQEEDYSKGITHDFEKVELKDNEYFVMGDNREDSLDSRRIGPLNVEQIKGTTKLVVYPFSKVGNI